MLRELLFIMFIAVLFTCGLFTFAHKLETDMMQYRVTQQRSIDSLVN